MGVLDLLTGAVGGGPGLLSAGASLLGGIFGRNSEKAAIDAQNAYNAPDQIRARAEKAGFNPLLFVGPGVGQQTAVGGSNYMGQAIAEAGLMAADNLTQWQSSQKLSKAMDANRRLSQQLTQATIRPKVGGIYAGTEMAPSRREALGVGRGKVSAVVGPVDVGGVGGARSGVSDPLAAPDALDPRRKVDAQPITSESGWSVVDNPYTGRFRVPAFQGEIPDVWQIPTIGAAWAFDKLHHAYGLWQQDRSYSAARNKREAQLQPLRDAARLAQDRGTVKAGYMGFGARNQNF